MAVALPWNPLKKEVSESASKICHCEESRTARDDAVIFMVCRQIASVVSLPRNDPSTVIAKSPARDEAISRHSEVVVTALHSS
ncbi:MAG TPA: hypothetical protein PKH81_09340 [Treponemataceae bacterium]|nr:hypothetical protein [Treponemataceae bacterium]